MTEFIFHKDRRELHEARRVVADALARQGMDAQHVSDVVAVVNELIAAARESGVATPVQLTVTSYTLLTSVRLRCDRNVELRDKPFDLRERLIQHLVIAFGRRRRDDGSIDLWAELERR